MTLNTKFCSKFDKNHWLLKLISIILIVGAAFFAWTKISSGAAREFAAADDFPRGALVYAQFRDLPLLVKLWDESDLKKRYLTSENFDQFQNRHLALKLVSRFEEFDAALGLGGNLGIGTIVGATENQAAVAIYDIGKLEFLLIAPLSAEKFKATVFYQQQEQLKQFEETTLDESTVYYSQKVDADRGRQKQKVLFANLKGRFILATSETLLLRAINNLNGKNKKDSLSNEPSFQNLTARFVPRAATIWVDQAKLNEDWYFKHYWVMRNIEDLKTIRAGIFDFEVQPEKLIERREFLLNEKNALQNSNANSKISPRQIAQLQKLIPKDVPFYKLQAIENKSDQALNSIKNTILERLVSPNLKTVSTEERWNSYDSFDETAEDYYSNGENSYSYLDHKFDKFIDEKGEEENSGDRNDFVREHEKKLDNNLQKILAAPEPISVLSMTSPQNLEKPLFVKFRKAVVFSLRSPSKFDRQAFENETAALMQNRAAISGEKIDLRWNDVKDKSKAIRQLILPFSNSEIYYAQQNTRLIVSNNGDFLKSIINNDAQTFKEELLDAVDELIVIDLNKSEQAFESPMNLLIKARGEDSQQEVNDSSTVSTKDFFMGNVNSLLDAVGQSTRIQIARNHVLDRLHEEIEISLNKASATN